MVIASSSAFAAPYAFKITCKDPSRLSTSVWSAYNSLGSTDKKIVPCPGVGHRVPGSLHAQQQRWLAQ